MRIAPFLYGIGTFIPGFFKLTRRQTGGSLSGRYCYAVWMRHATRAAQAGAWHPPRVVAELGPGDSIGTGLAALLTGVHTYIALDLVPFASRETNLDVFEEILDLVGRRSPIPDDAEFPELRPRLRSYAFPDYLWSPDALRAALHPDRISAIRAELRGETTAAPFLRYAAPWTHADIVAPASVDMVFSQAVFEHVDDFATGYAASASWLHKDGFATHTLDFKSHNLTHLWNGHLAIGPLRWKLLRGKRPYLLNRASLSDHLEALQNAGFRVGSVERYQRIDGVKKAELDRRFAEWSDDDLATSEAFICALKRSPVE